MSPEHLLISKTITSSDIDTPIKLGIKPDHLSGQWPDIWRWMVDYNRQHGQVPSDRAIRNEYGIDLHNADNETFSGLVDEIVDAFKQRLIVDTIATAMPKVNDGDTSEAMKILTSGLQRATIETVRMRDVDIIQNWEKRIARYEEMRNEPNALRGIPTGLDRKSVV